MPDLLTHQIHVVNRDQHFMCSENQTLLMGMANRNVEAINIGCRGGGCGVCKIRILSGAFEAKRMSKAHISEGEQRQGFMLACRVFPRTDLVIESDHYQTPDELA